MEAGAIDMSGEVRLPEARWSRVGVSGSFRVVWGEGVNQLKISLPLASSVPRESQEAWCALKSPRMSVLEERGSR